MKLYNMKKLSLLAMPMLLLSGCTSEEPLLQNGSESGVPLVVESVSVSSQVSTRADEGYQDLGDGESIGLFLEGADVGSYTELKNIRYTKTGNTIGPANSGETIWLGAKDANVCAYYLPSLSITDKTAYKMTTDYYDEANDLVYAKDQTVNGTADKCNVNFSMIHAYAQIEFNFKRDNYPNTCKITTMTLKNKSLAKSGTLNLAKGSMSVLSGDFASEQTFNTDPNSGDGITIDATNDIHKINLLVVPCNLDKSDADNVGLSVVFNVDTKDMTMNIPHATLPAIVAGKKYTITANLKGTGITVSSVQVEQWEENTVGDFEPMP